MTEFVQLLQDWEPWIQGLYWPVWFLLWSKVFK